MDNNIKILQVFTETWTGQDGKTRTDYIGLGEDSNLYKWHRGTGKWLLFVIQK